MCGSVGSDRSSATACQFCLHASPSDSGGRMRQRVPERRRWAHAAAGAPVAAAGVGGCARQGNSQRWEHKAGEASGRRGKEDKEERDEWKKRK